MIFKSTKFFCIFWLSICIFYFFIQLDNWGLYFNYLVGLNTWVWNFFYNFLIICCFNPMCKRLVVNIIVGLYIYDYLYTGSILSQEISYEILPTSLLAGSIIIHPILFYIFVNFLVLYLVLRKESLQIAKISSLVIYVLVCGSVALLLGGLWGLQSNVWGYLWVSDQIEWFLLECIFLLLISSHTIYKTHIKYMYLIVILILLNNLLCLRFNLISTRHSFLVKKTLIYLLVIYILFIYIYNFYIWRNNYIIVKLNLITLFFAGLIIYYFYYNSLVWVLMYVLVLFFILQIKKRFTIEYSYSLTVFHYSFLIWINLWVLSFNPFNFFFTFSQISIVDKLDVYTNLLTHNLSIWTWKFSHESLEFINFNTNTNQYTYYLISVINGGVIFLNQNIISILIIVILLLSIL